MNVVTKKKGKPITAAEIWKNDNHKLNLLKERDIDVIIVWDSDFQENPDCVIKRCHEKILGKINENK